MFRAPGAPFPTSPLAHVALLSLGYLGGAELGHVLSLKTQEQTFATFWPPAGLLLATLVLTRYRWWPGMLVGACLAHLISDVLFRGRSVLVSLSFCVANCGEACLGAWLLRRFAGLPFRVARIRDVLGLACLSALLSTVVGATIGAGTVHLAFNASYWPAWVVWWISDGVGVLVVAPVVFAWAARDVGFVRALPPWRMVEGAVLLLGLVLAAEGVYGEFLPPPLTVPVFILPFLLWAGLRFGPRGASTAVLVVALIGAWNVSQGRGPYTGPTISPRDQLLRAQATLFVISLSVLVLAVLVSERRQAEQQRIQLIAELELALAEIKTLRGLIPICAWCKKIRDDQGFWLRLEDYLHAHTEAEFTHGMCPECLDKQLAVLKRGL